VFNNFSPRVGLTYDLAGNGRTIVRANYARYYGQVGVGGVAGQVNPAGAVTVRYPWTDLNGDRNVQANEVFPTNGDFRNFQNITGNWDPANPSSPSTKNTIDPNLKNDATDEFIVGASRELGHGIAVDANYIYRNYSDFNATYTQTLDAAGSPVGFVTSNDYISTTFTPTCTVSDARCDTVTAFYPTFQLSAVNQLRNQPNFHRTFNGIELNARRRMANHYMLNGSFTYNTAVQHYGDGDFVNPTNIAQQNNAQYAPQSTGSGIGNVFLNSRWLAKVSGMYQAPYKINVSAFYNARQGYPFEATVVLTAPIVLSSTGQTVTTLPNGGGLPAVLLDSIGDNRLPTFQNLDFRVERPINFGGMHLVPGMDIFNVTNNNTIQARRPNQNATNGNFIQAITAPRVLRFGVRVTW